MPVSPKIRQTLERSSWIRKMFEEGGRLKEQFGAENVFGEFCPASHTRCSIHARSPPSSAMWPFFAAAA